MAKTYNTIGTFTSGAILTAAQMNEIGTNTNNYRVPPLCRVYRNAALSHTSSANNQTPAFDTESFTNTDGGAVSGMWTSGDGSKITIRTAGVYVVTATIQFAANGTGFRQLEILLNGTTVIGKEVEAGNSSYSSTLNASTIYSFAATNYIQCQVYQNSGGNLAYDVGIGTMTLSAAWVGQAV